MNKEIEKKFLIKELPDNLENYPFHQIEQGYLNVSPAVRVRRQDDEYIMTYKGTGVISHDEYNLHIDKTSYEHLIKKADGNIICKKRYLIPLNKDAFDEDFYQKNKELIDSFNMRIELDVFEKPFEDIILAEVEFPSEEAAKAYRPAAWFKEDVTGNRSYSNANMSSRNI